MVSVERIVGTGATGEICHIVIDHMGKMPYWEGQSYGVIPPGINPKNGKPFTNRLYSIASTRYGDDMTVRSWSSLLPVNQGLPDTLSELCRGEQQRFV